MSNKELVLRAVTDLLVNRDLSAIEKYYEGYIQHNPFYPSGIENLKKLVPALKPDFKYEAGLAMEQDDFVMVHGRYTGWAGKTFIAVDIFKVVNGKIVEHWDVLQEEVPPEKSVNGNTMFPVI